MSCCAERTGESVEKDGHDDFRLLIYSLNFVLPLLTANIQPGSRFSCLWWHGNSEAIATINDVVQASQPSSETGESTDDFVVHHRTVDQEDQRLSCIREMVKVNHDYYTANGNGLMNSYEMPWNSRSNEPFLTSFWLPGCEKFFTFAAPR